MDSWPKINKKLGYVIPKDEITRRELILISWEELLKLETAKKSKNKSAENLHNTKFGLIKTTLALY